MSLVRAMKLEGDLPSAPEPAPVPEDWPHAAPPPVSPYGPGAVMMFSTGGFQGYGTTAPFHQGFVTSGD